MHMQAYAALGEFVRFGVRINTVGKEDVDEVVVGVAPEDGARKSLMSKCFLAGSGWQDRAFLLMARRVKAQTATLATVQHIGGGEQLYRLFLEEGDTVVSAAVHQHLEKYGQIGDIGEKSGIAANATKDGSRLVVDIALHHLLAESAVIFGGCNGVDVDGTIRIEAGVVHPQRAIEVLLEVFVHRGTREYFHHLFQEHKA